MSVGLLCLVGETICLLVEVPAGQRLTGAHSRGEQGLELLRVVVGILVLVLLRCLQALRVPQKRRRT